MFFPPNLRASMDSTRVSACRENSAKQSMEKNKTRRPWRMTPLEIGQVWRVADLHLQVDLVGRLLVHYKLAKPQAIRRSNRVDSKETIEKYLKRNKAVLIQG